MPCAVESSNQSKHFIVRQVPKSHSSVNRIVSFVFKDGFSGWQIYSRQVPSLGASCFAVALTEKRFSHLICYLLCRSKEHVGLCLAAAFIGKQLT